MTFLQGGTQGTAGAAGLGAVGRAEGQHPRCVQGDVLSLHLGHLWTHRDAEELLLQGSDQLPEQTPVGGVTPQNPVRFSTPELGSGLEKNEQNWPGASCRCAAALC